MKNFFAKFFAVDNAINENVVIGTLLILVFLAGLIVRAVGVQSISDEMLYMTLGAALASFGIGGFKK